MTAETNIAGVLLASRRNPQGCLLYDKSLSGRATVPVAYQLFTSCLPVAYQLNTQLKTQLFTQQAMGISTRRTFFFKDLDLV